MTFNLLQKRGFLKGLLTFVLPWEGVFATNIPKVQYFCCKTQMRFGILGNFAKNLQTSNIKGNE